jgi:hypothetical protein
MTLSTLRVLAALGRHTNAEGWCFINQGRLAHELGVSRQAVNMAVKKLVEWDYLEKRATRRKDGGNGVCDYRVKLDQNTEAEPEELSTGDDTPLSTSDFTGAVNSGADRPLSTLEFTTVTTHEGTTPINDIDRDFAEWYAACPRKQARERAKRAYLAARKKTDAKTLLEGIQRYTAWCQSSPPTETKFTQLPATWLNGGGWDDELTPKDGKAQSVKLDLPGVPITLHHPARRDWIRHWEGREREGDGAASMKLTWYVADKTVREDTEYPPGTRPTTQPKEAAE